MGLVKADVTVSTQSSSLLQGQSWCLDFSSFHPFSRKGLSAYLVPDGCQALKTRRIRCSPYVQGAYSLVGLPMWCPVGKEPAYQCRRLSFDPWVGKIPWRKAWQPTPVFLPGESHGQRRLVGYHPRCHKESDTQLEQLSRHAQFR